MSKNNALIGLILMAVVVLLGVIVYPIWWYRFIFEGGIFKFSFWARGIKDILIFILHNPIYLFGILVLYLLAKKKVIDIKFPSQNFFSNTAKISVTVILSILIGFFIWVLPSREGIEDLKDYYQVQTPNTEPQTEIIPLDFIYINTERINTLFDQIKPTLSLKEKQLENRQGDNKEISNGSNPILNAKRDETNERSQKDTYVASEISNPQKVTSLLTHFKGKNLLKEYQSLEFSSEDVKKLDSFRTTAKQFNIEYNSVKYNEVYNRVIGETLVKEHVTIKNLTGIVLIKGDFLVRLDTSKIMLSHNYFLLDEKNRITFKINSLSKFEKISSSLKDESQNNKLINLTVFGKVTRVESDEKISDVFIDVYSIW